MTSVGCETVIPSGSECQIAAVGRCSTCGHAFCDTHRARSLTGAAYTDFCASCSAAREAEKQDRLRREAEVRSWERERIKECLAMLERAGVHPRERFATKIEYKSFGRTARKAVPLDPAWPVGDLSWKYSETSRRGETVEREPTGVTRDLNLVLMDGDRTGGTLEAWSPHLIDGPYGNDSVRHQVLKALEHMINELRTP